MPAKRGNARALLQRLAEDDDFRARVEANPAEALAEYGFDIDASIAPARVMLPSKEDIRADIDTLSQQFEASNTWVIFMR